MSTTIAIVEAALGADLFAPDDLFKAANDLKAKGKITDFTMNVIDTDTVFPMELEWTAGAVGKGDRWKVWYNNVHIGYVVDPAELFVPDRFRSQIGNAETAAWSLFVKDQYYGCEDDDCAEMAAIKMIQDLRERGILR